MKQTHLLNNTPAQRSALTTKHALSHRPEVLTVGEAEPALGGLLARNSRENLDGSCGARTLRAAPALLPTYGHDIVSGSEVGVERVSTRLAQARHACAPAPHRLAGCENSGLDAPAQRGALTTKPARRSICEFLTIWRAAPALAGLFLLAGALAFSQSQGDTKQRARAAHDLGKQGEQGIPKLAPYITDTDLSVRVEAVKSLDDIGGPKTLDLLVQATKDADPEVQIRATDGLVNVYLPGYLKTGISGSLQRVGDSVKAKFTDTNDQIVDAYVEVRPDVIEALGRLAVSGSSVESRVNACRALGILRGRAAIPQLAEALHSKDNQTMYEALVALQKIRDPASASRVTFLVHDLDERVQMTAIQTAGLLLDHEAAPDIRDVMGRTRSARVRRAAASSLAMLADPADHESFLRDLADEKDDALRSAGAEGLGRLRNPSDRPIVEKAFNAEHKLNPRLSEAFAVVMLGNLDTSEFSSLRYLVNTLNQKSYQGVALPFLVELARDQAVRQALYPLLTGATKDEKIQLGTVLARSGDQDSVPYLEALTMDPDTEVAQDSIRNLRTLRNRLQ